MEKAVGSTDPEIGTAESNGGNRTVTDGKKTPRKKMSKKVLREYLFVYGMILLPIIQFCIFYIWINANSIIMAFQEFDVDASGFNGEVYRWSLYNFKRFFAEWTNPSSVVVPALLNTLKYFTAGVIMIPVTFLVSYFLYKQIWGYKIFRVVFFLPSIVSAVLFVTTYIELIKYGGALSTVWSWFGKELPELVNDPDRTTGTIIAFTVWTGFGVNMILYQSAMSRVPEEIIEAAQLDGCPWYRELWSIIIPMVWPTISTTLILQFTSLFNSTGPILLFADAGRQSLLDNKEVATIAFWIYRKTQSGTDLNYPAAIGMIFTAISVPIVFFVRWVFNKIDPDVTY